MYLAEALTRRQAQAQESRRRLMDGALALFARQGYAETSVHAICQSAGMADGLLYHYFPDGKQELLHALVEEHIRAVITELRARANTLMDDLPIEEVLEQLYQNINDIVLRHAAAFQMLLRERNVLELVSMEQLIRLLVSQQQWFPGLLRHRAHRGEIGEMDYQSAAESLNSQMLYHLIMELLGFSASPLGDPGYRRRLIDYQVGLWKRGTAPRNASSENANRGGKNP